jgi:SAM-dependent methyltransferase
MTSASDWLGWLNTLGDLSRVRVLRLLHQQELGVGELAKALQLPQSTVSRHLKPLFDAGWIVKRSEGTASLYRLNESALEPSARELWSLTARQLGPTPAFAEDDARLTEVLNERRQDTRSFFGRLGGEWDALRRELFGEAFGAEGLLHLIDPTLVVADLGCGTGNAAALLAPVVKKVIAVDREPTMLDAAKARLADFSNVEFRKGQLEKLPLRDGEANAAVMVLVLHHLPDPAVALREAARILSPKGTLLVIDMVAHDRGEYRHTMGHHHLGFDLASLRGFLKPAGLANPRYTRLRPHTAGKGPGLFVAAAQKPA